MRCLSKIIPKNLILLVSSIVADPNGHHQEWLGSTTTNRHGVAAIDFATVSDCDQLVVGPTHARGGTLDILMTNSVKN